MKQVEIFFGEHLSDVKLNINNWLKEHSDYKIISISDIRERMKGTTWSFSFYCSVVYEK